MIDANSLSGTGEVRIQAHLYVASLFERRPEAIAVVAGTGLVAPTFS